MVERVSWVVLLEKSWVRLDENHKQKNIKSKIMQMQDKQSHRKNKQLRGKYQR